MPKIYPLQLLSSEFRNLTGKHDKKSLSRLDNHQSMLYLETSHREINDKLDEGEQAIALATEAAAIDFGVNQICQLS
jgi:hypothetical protein